MRKIIILGGGYGGMKCISNLLKGKTKEPFQIYLVDRTPHHTLKTEFFALAAGTVSEKHVKIKFPKNRKLTFIQGEVKKIDIENKQIIIENQETLFYDYLVIGLGCEDEYRELQGAREHTLSVQTPVKSILALEKIKSLPEESNIIVMGGGLTGIELASEIQQTYPRHNLHILEHGETILAPYSPKIKKYAKKWFTKKGVNIITEVHTEKIEEGKVYYNDGQVINANLIFWAGGISSNHLVIETELPLDPTKKVIIDQNNRASGHEDIFVIGDCASSKLPASAQLAQQHGVNTSKTIKELLNGKVPGKGIQIKSKGMMGSLGRYTGFGTIFGLTVIGIMPRMIKYVINITYKWSIK